MFNILKEKFPKFSTVLFYLYLERLLSDCKTILDLGCGDNSPLRFLRTRTYGIDANREAIKLARRRKTHKNLRVMDVMEVKNKFKDRAFEAVVALDLIEHLSKKEGLKLLASLESKASKKIIIFTPNGFIPQSGDSVFDKHRSGWTVDVFKTLGYRVFGIYGPKILRGKYHKIKYKPEIFFAIISDIIQWTFSINNPNSAAALLAVKNLKKSRQKT